MSCSIFGDAFLLLSLGKLAILRFFIVLGIVMVLYIVYGVHGASRHDAQLADYVAARYVLYLSLLRAPVLKAYACNHEQHVSDRTLN